MDEEGDQVIHRVRQLLNLRITTAKDPDRRNGAQPDAKHNLSGADKIARWKKLFLSYDKDKSGTITFREMVRMLRNSLHLGENQCPDKDLQLVFDKLDQDGSGAIEFSEFCSFVSTKPVEASQDLPTSVGRALRLALSREKVTSHVDLRNVFQSNDLNGDNILTFHEFFKFFRNVLRVSQHEISEFHIKKLYRVLDLDKDGWISLEEFMHWVTDNVDLSKGRRGFVSSRFGGLAPKGANAMGTTLPALSKSSARIDALKMATSGSPKGQSSPGDRKTYMSIPRAGRLNHVEQRLFEAGFDVRGGFFKVSDQAEASSRSRLLRSTGALMARSATSLGGRSSGSGEGRLLSSKELFAQIQ